ncbi:NADH dehydrogenase subunit E [Pontibacter ummariensis]|uniref:NADH dehydrogenase subunit E n=1 Tax=Pontibacter ummariensis TaxID=1610492 RepID=A0A239GMD7_9BACT|nr:NADH-quinone oxidoreductase subunit NuoE [Pontibacter ummariensis]PRY11330.1 NADH dehydrogenase subunit E [Pontibacter ummariensis]SNS69982.1 NADH dehydrogenase subunit E [Pontibacter ummariensis]
MLTAQEKHQIDHEISLVPTPQNACIEALKIVQQRQGWISDESLKDVAEYVGMSPAELDSVATFYNLIFRKPVGRHVILVCDSITCWVMGYEDIRDHLYNKLNITYGQTTEDGRFTLLPNCCLGTCDCAPTLMIDNDLYRNLTVEQLDEILIKYT